MGRPKGNLGWRDSSSAAKKPEKKKQVKKVVVEAAPPKPYDGPLPFELLQLLLNIFKDSFSELFESDITPILQEVKQHLFNRDFAQAFGRQDYLQAYAVRWSPSRALGYLEIFDFISKYAFTNDLLEAATLTTPYKVVCFGGGGGAEVVALGGYLDYLNRQRNAQAASTPADQKDEAGQETETTGEQNNPQADSACTDLVSEAVPKSETIRSDDNSKAAQEQESAQSKPKSIESASEEAPKVEATPSAEAISQPTASNSDELTQPLADLSLVPETTASLDSPDANLTPVSQGPHFYIHPIDIATWSPVITTLTTSLTTLPPIYKYASSAAKAANRPLLPTPSPLSVTSQQHDLLNLDATTLSALLADAKLVTLMFTLNELYSTNLGATQELLGRVGKGVARGGLLLVVDSPGSYSTITLASGEKNYPMSWLLDFTLLGKEDEEEEQGARFKGGKKEEKEVKEKEWEKVLGEESRWWRMPAGLKYPIELENMRYQLHLFRRL